MTKEEAKGNLIYAIRWNDMPKKEALDMAIKALEQEPCPNAISRSDMLDAIGHGTTYTSEELQRIIKALPPVNPQPKTGHWTRELIRNEKGGCIGAKMICSECGNDNKHDEYMNYCPNCGCRMVELQESEDTDGISD